MSLQVHEGTKIGGISKGGEESIVKSARRKEGWSYIIHFEKLEKFLKNNNRFDEEVF